MTEEDRDMAADQTEGLFRDREEQAEAGMETPAAAGFDAGGEAAPADLAPAAEPPEPTPEEPPEIAAGGATSEQAATEEAPVAERPEAEPDSPSPAPDETEESMAAFVDAIAAGDAQSEAGLVNLKTGDIVQGHVVQVGTDSLLVDVGYKSEGVIPLHEFTYRHVADAHEVANVGDEIEAMVLSIDREEGTLRLSRRRAEEARSWNRLREAADANQVLEVPVVEAVKGGLVADVGTRGFIPASQVERGFTSDLARYVGQTVRVRIIELDRAKHRVILSRRVVLEEERREMRDLTWDQMADDEVRDGAVKSLTPFGAFIDLGGVDGLLHVSEISWGRISHPSEVLHEGQQVRVKILHMDRQRGRISLSMRQVQENPWDTVSERYSVDSEHDGRVVRLANFGAFVELEPGIDGLVHVSELGEGHVARPGDAVQVGDAVRCRVLRVSPTDRRVSLTLRGATQPGRPRDEAPASSEAARAPSEEAPGSGMTIGDMWGRRLPDMNLTAQEQEPDEEPEAQTRPAGAGDTGAATDAPEEDAVDAGAPEADAPEEDAVDAGAPEAGAPEEDAVDAGAPEAGAPEEDAGEADAG